MFQLLFKEMMLALPSFDPCLTPLLPLLVSHVYVAPVINDVMLWPLYGLLPSPDIIATGARARRGRADGAHGIIAMVGQDSVVVLRRKDSGMAVIPHDLMKASRVLEGLVVEGEEEVGHLEVPQTRLSGAAVVVDSLVKVGRIIFGKQKQCGAHRPVLVLVPLVPRVQQVLLHEDAGVLILLMILVS